MRSGGQRPTLVLLACAQGMGEEQGCPGRGSVQEATITPRLCCPGLPHRRLFGTWSALEPRKRPREGQTSGPLSRPAGADYAIRTTGGQGGVPPGWLNGDVSLAICVVSFEESQVLQAGAFQMVQAVREAGAYPTASSPCPPLALSLQSEARAQPTSQAESPLGATRPQTAHALTDARNRLPVGPRLISCFSRSTP